MNFENIFGNTEAKNYLLNTVKQKNILHSYLFLGTEGIGKLLIAKEFAKKILCMENAESNCSCKSCLCFEDLNHPDFLCVNEQGENIKIEQIRTLIEKVIEKPIMSSKKVYILNDFDKTTKEAQNCLLKTLEEPPEFAVIILIASNENLILNTIKSRCMTLKFKNIPDDILSRYAKENLKYENITENLLKSFDGSIGKAEKLKNNSEKYSQIEILVSNLSRKDIIDIMLEAKILYDKENIYDILNYLIICLYSQAKENEKYIYGIEYVNKAINRLKGNSNFDMTLDSMILDIWEVINENSNRC